MEKEEIKKSDEQILFPEVKVGDITVKPWSFGILFDISDLLEQVLTKAEEKKVDLDSDFITYVTMVKLFTIANTQVLKIMSITLNIPEEDIRNLPMEDGLKIAIIIAKQNWGIISKNVLNLLFSKKKEEDKENKKKKEQLRKKIQQVSQKYFKLYYNIIYVILYMK